jgi:hypothetical protein
MALRKAFNVSGVYAPEEMDREIQGVSIPLESRVDNTNDEDPPTQMQTDMIKKLAGESALLPKTQKEAREEIARLTSKK